MKTTKLIFYVLIVAVIAVLIAYAVSPDARLQIDSLTSSFAAATFSFHDQIVTTPLWATYFEPYLVYWGFGTGALTMTAVWFAFTKLRRFFVKSAQKDVGFMQGPAYAPPVVVPQPQQPQPQPST